MPEVKLNVALLSHTKDPENVVAMAAKLCYSKASVKDLKEKIEKKDQEKFIKHLADVGHESPLEHASFTFAIEGISRACSHQLVRHRIASYSQQSQRYCDFMDENLDYIIPPEIYKDTKSLIEFIKGMDATKERYEELRAAGAAPQDSRFVLPNAAETKVIVTMNARSLRHFFNLRCCNRAQWEIRNLAQEMHRLVKEVAPSLFSGSGPSCVVLGKCPEGPRCCGEYEEMEKKYK